ncbi:MAG: Tc toxin subunit A, partial [Pyrinomonadaceae bacterium]
MDETTAKRLNEVLTARGFFPPKQRPFRDRQFLRLKLREGDRLDEEARDFVRQRLNQELKETILREFTRPSETLEAAVRDMDLDYAKLTGESLRTVLLDQVLPALLDRPELERELERHSERGFSASTATVAEVLSLDQDLRRHPLFREEARRTRNASLSAIAKLNARQTEAIEDLDLDAADAETWNRLVSDGVLTDRKREDLQNTVEFAKLSDDKFEVIEALRAERRLSSRDLITLDRSDWLGFLTRHQIEPPEGDDLETYAQLLDRNVQQTFRTPYLMHRLVERKRDDVLNRTADLDRLLTRNEVIFDNEGINKNLVWDDVSEDQRPSVEASLRELNRFAKTYRYLGIADILNNRSLSARQKQRAIGAKQQLLQTFHANNPDLDLEWVSLLDVKSRVGRAFHPSWNGIDEEDQPQVRRTMMAFQRTQGLTENFDEAETLLAAGLDSAVAIVGLSEREVARRLNLTPAAVERIYRKAGHQALLTGHALSLIEEETTHAPSRPASLYESGGGPNLDIINVLKDIDGYEDIFGNQNYCHCKHCRSIFGPAAYFVDLMDFIQNNVSKSIFIDDDKTEHPLYLKNRRGDLWTLVLSCKNTDTRIPYLTIVNEVLERYLERVFEEEDIYEALTEARL